MAMASIAIFDKTLQTTSTWLKDIMRDAGWEDPHKAYLALRAVLHALRDRLIPEEATDLGAQLPMLIRGFYFEGWTLRDKPLKIRSKEEFLDRIGMQFPDPEMDPEKAARVVFGVLARKISNGEIKDVKASLPKDIQELWPD